MVAIIFGIYIGISICYFLVLLGGAVLGGREEDLIWPFILAPLWPVILLCNIFRFGIKIGF